MDSLSLVLFFDPRVYANDSLTFFEDDILGPRIWVKEKASCQY